jgi:hypothetical protein
MLSELGVMWSSPRWESNPRLFDCEAMLGVGLTRFRRKTAGRGECGFGLGGARPRWYGRRDDQWEDHRAFGSGASDSQVRRLPICVYGRRRVLLGSIGDRAGLSRHQIPI